MSTNRTYFPLLVLVLASACTEPDPREETPRSLSEVHLESQVSGTDVLLQAVSAVDEEVVWVSGHGGTWARTLDGGATWTAHVSSAFRTGPCSAGSTVAKTSRSTDE